MKLANFSVNRPVAVIMVVLALMMIGAVSLSGLHLDLLPEMELPVAIVITGYTGSAPQEVENMVTRPLEEVLGTVGNISSISSMSSMGSSVVIAQFEMGTDMEFAALEMREKIDMVRGFLPEGADDPMVIKMDINLMPVLVLGISGERPVQELKAFAEDIIKPQIERLEGVASVEVTGGLTREIQVIVEPERLAAHGLSISQVVQALQLQNMNLSAGRVARGGQEMALRVIGEYDEVDQVAGTVLTTSSGTRLSLKDVARVEDGFKDITGFSRLGEQPGISITVQKQSGANTVSVVRSTGKPWKAASQFPEGVSIFTVMDQAEYIEFSISNVTSNSFAGGDPGYAGAVCFLRNLRSTLIIALSMPISVIATFILIYFGGLNLNMMSLGAGAWYRDDGGQLYRGSGKYLQDARKGLDRMEAAKSGANEVATP